MYNVLVFAYDFKHKKTEDFINILKSNKINVVGVIGAEAIKLKLPEKKYKRSIPQKVIFGIKDLCKEYNIPYFVNKHNSKETENIVKKIGANIAIISGARILSSATINMFKYGIINFHPGKIPEASGLDGLFWSIYKDIPPFVTTHLIDEKIDAGRIIYEKEVCFNALDRIEDVKHYIYLAELSELDRLSKEYLSVGKIIRSKTILNYTSSNPPMSVKNQEEVLHKFEKWKYNILRENK